MDSITTSPTDCPDADIYAHIFKDGKTSVCTLTGSHFMLHSLSASIPHLNKCPLIRVRSITKEKYTKRKKV